MAPAADVSAARGALPHPPSLGGRSETIGALLDELATTLGGEGLPPDRATARDVLAMILDVPRFWPTAHRVDIVEPQIATTARAAARAMRSGMPMAYAVGKAAFRHLTLRVDRRVLIPRPETELLVDLALAATGGRGRIADIGTGSGAVALALAAEGQYDRVIATDISRDALMVAESNLEAVPADRRGVLEFRLGDMIEALAGISVGAVVSNPPYIANHERDALPAAVRDWEPATALFAGDDGMAAIARLVSGAADVLDAGGLLLIEIDTRRATEARDLAETNGRWTDVQIRPDLTGRERFLAARRATR